MLEEKMQSFIHLELTQSETGLLGIAMWYMFKTVINNQFTGKGVPKEQLYKHHQDEIELMKKLLALSGHTQMGEILEESIAYEFEREETE
jgi:hypothetical protein